MKISDCEVGRKYYVINGAWYFIVLSKDENGISIRMSNGEVTNIPNSFEDLDFESVDERNKRHRDNETF